MAILPTDIRILFTNYDIIAYFLNLASCSEHFISIKHRILSTFNINKKNQFERLYAFKFECLFIYKIEKTHRIPHYGNDSKIQQKSRRKRSENCHPWFYTQIYDRSLSWLGTGTSIKSGGVKLVLWVQLFGNNKVIYYLCSCIQHLTEFFVLIILFIFKISKQEFSNIIIVSFFLYYEVEISSDKT